MNTNYSVVYKEPVNPLTGEQIITKYSYNIVQESIDTNKNQETIIEKSENEYNVNNASIETSKIGNTHAAILFDDENIDSLNINNVYVKTKEGSTTYNVFEQACSSSVAKLKNLNVNNLTIDGTNITHNFLNFYNIDDNATLSISNSTFDIKMDNEILRLANISKTKNVTVIFDNIDWKYDETYNQKDLCDWCAIVLYQSALGGTNRIEMKEEIDCLKTWNFIFKNCRYNGVKVTSNPSEYECFNRLIIGWDNKKDEHTIFNGQGTFEYDMSKYTNITVF